MMLHRVYAPMAAFCAACLVFLVPVNGQAAGVKGSGKAPVAVASNSKQAAAESIDTAHEKLKTFASEHLSRANVSLRPNRGHPEVRKRGGSYVAVFQEVDVASLQTEIYESNTPGCVYVGHIVYAEKVFESEAGNKKDALSGEFKSVKTRRIRELTRFTGGKWHY